MLKEGQFCCSASSPGPEGTGAHWSLQPSSCWNWNQYPDPLPITLFQSMGSGFLHRQRGPRCLRAESVLIGDLRGAKRRGCSLQRQRCACCDSREGNKSGRGNTAMGDTVHLARKGSVGGNNASEAVRDE